MKGVEDDLVAKVAGSAGDEDERLLLVLKRAMHQFLNEADATVEPSSWSRRTRKGSATYCFQREAGWDEAGHGIEGEVRDSQT